MPAREHSGTTAVVTGASRGFGRGIATALTGAGVQVARDRARLDELGAQLGGSFTPVSADAADPSVAGQLIDAYHPATVVLNAGASPLMRPLQHHTWETFSVNWHTDVRIAFHWLREALLQPLRPGSRGGRNQQRRRGGRVTAQRRVRRRQGHRALHHRVRPGRGTARRPGHHSHRRTAPDHAADRPGPAGGPGVRGPQRPVRTGVPPADWRTAHPRAGRPGDRRPCHRPRP